MEFFTIFFAIIRKSYFIFNKFEVKNSKKKALFLNRLRFNDGNRLYRLCFIMGSNELLGGRGYCYYKGFSMFEWNLRELMCSSNLWGSSLTAIAQVAA